MPHRERAAMPPPKLVNEPSHVDLRSFQALVASVFQGNINDNAFRMLVWLFLGGAVATAHQGDPDSYRSLVGVVFTAPWVLLSLLAGQLADRYPKAAVAVWTKAAEVVLMAAAAVSLWLFGIAGWWLALFFLGLVAARTCLFGPATYGMLPELMPERRLSWGNGWVDGATFAGGVFGTIFAGWAIVQFGSNLHTPLFMMAFFSLAGLFATRQIRWLPAADPSVRLHAVPLGRVAETLRVCRRTPGMLWSIAGLVAWWAMAALALQAAMKLAEDSLMLNAWGTSRFFLYVVSGVAVGALCAGYLSGRRIEVGLVPFGGFGMAFFGALVYFLPPTETLIAPAIALVGFFSGFFFIPLKAFVQHNAPIEIRGSVIGTANLFTYLGITFSAGLLYYVMTVVLRFDAQDMFLAVSVFGLVSTLTVLYVIPGATLRFILFVFARTIYRLKVEGRHNLPEKGGALLVCNHMSYADGLLVISAMDRPARCVMFEDIYNHPLVKPFAKLTRAIPISDRMGPREMIRALQDAGEAIKQGDIVCIFAEGQITRTGQMLPFRRGFERVMRGVDAPIIPMHLDRVWGSILSFSGKRWLLKLPKRIPYPITVTFGGQMPGDSAAPAVRKAVLQLATDAWMHRKKDAPLLHHDVFKTARRRPLGKFMFDARRPEGITRLEFATAVLVLARAMRGRWRGQKRVGICLPPSIAGAALNHAALLMGKVPVNLNYTADAATIAHICEQCGIRNVTTSRAFLEKFPVDLPGEIIHAEDLAGEATKGVKIRCLLKALFAPIAWLEIENGAKPGRSVDDTATIIFSSGSTGVPKGVMLSHWNLYSNIEATGQLISLSRRDGILGVLPFFHSFGTMATIFLPITLGIRVAYHPSPLDPPAIGELVRKHKLTLLIATPTFLSLYTRKIDAADFGSLEIVITGAEKLRSHIADGFERKFGIKVYEGYGCTETSPVAAVNTHDYRAPGLYQVGNKPGKIGHPIPGCAFRIVHPESGETLPDGEEGLILVKGPNVMKGYFRMPEKTAEVLRDGWYSTGDVGRIDEDGFVEITDRLARFSKIGGEMVPHMKVENALQKAAGGETQQFAVTSVPDKNKGERLAVLYTCSEDEARAAHKEVAASGLLPNLWIPKFGDFVAVEEIPLLGSGKMDLRSIRQAAVEALGAEA